MATRDRPTSAAPAPGDETLDTYDTLWEAVLDAATWHLTNVGGTANAITADVDPELPAGGLETGMKFSIIWANTSTAQGVTLDLGTGPVNVIQRDGSTLFIGQLAADALDFLFYDGTNLRLFTPGEGKQKATPQVIEFNSSDVWVNDVPADTIISVKLVAGGRGGAGAGGNGGEAIEATFRAGNLPENVPIGIGAGGQSGQAGGDTTFGTYLTAYGDTASARPKGTYLGGAGGGTDSSGDPVPAGDSQHGGGGGAGQSGSPGKSELAGDGGAPNENGAAPGGGGGAGNSSGGKGRATITIYG